MVLFWFLITLLIIGLVYYYLRGKKKEIVRKEVEEIQPQEEAKRPKGTKITFGFREGLNFGFGFGMGIWLWGLLLVLMGMLLIGLIGVGR